MTQDLAWHYKQYVKEQAQEEREQLFLQRMNHGVKEVGLWRDSEPTQQWEWRKNK